MVAHGLRSSRSRRPCRGKLRKLLRLKHDDRPVDPVRPAMASAPKNDVAAFFLRESGGKVALTPADLAAAVPARRPSVTAPDVRENDDAFETAIVVIAVELVILAVDPTDAGE